MDKNHWKSVMIIKWTVMWIMILHKIWLFSNHCSTWLWIFFNFSETYFCSMQHVRFWNWNKKKIIIITYMQKTFCSDENFNIVFPEKKCMSKWNSVFYITDQLDFRMPNNNLLQSLHSNFQVFLNLKVLHRCYTKCLIEKN